MNLFKRDKQEKLGLDLQNPINQKAAIQASLDNKVPLINKGNGLFMVDIKHVKEKNLYQFLKQFINNSVNSRQGVVYKEDPKFDYILIYDKED